MRALLVLSIATALSLAACGVRGAPRAPQATARPAAGDPNQVPTPSQPPADTAAPRAPSETADAGTTP